MSNEWRESNVSIDGLEPIERETHLHLDDTMEGYFIIDSRQRLIIEHLQMVEGFIIDDYYTNSKGEIYYLRGRLPLNSLKFKKKFADNDRVNNVSYILQ